MSGERASTKAVHILTQVIGEALMLSAENRSTVQAIVGNAYRSSSKDGGAQTASVLPSHTERTDAYMHAWLIPRWRLFHPIPRVHGDE